MTVPKDNSDIYDLRKFTLSDMTECGAAIRKLGVGAESMAEAANGIVSYLYEHIVDMENRERSCVMIRFYKTYLYRDLDNDLQKFADSLIGDFHELPDMKCLTLLATIGDKPEWNSRVKSAGHMAIPLPSEKALNQIPMIAQLVKQFGLEASSVLKPDPSLIMAMEQKTYNVFYVPEAVGSPYIPAQEQFVVPFGVKSVLGFGGMLPTGDLFVIIMFSRVHIPRETAEMFKALAMNAKCAVLPFAGEKIFS